MIVALGVLSFLILHDTTHSLLQMAILSTGDWEHLDVSLVQKAVKRQICKSKILSQVPKQREVAPSHPGVLPLT